MRGILVPLDGSSAAEAVLHQVRRLAKGTDTELLLLRTYHLESIGTTYMALLPQFRREAEEYVARIETWLGREGYRVRTKVLEGLPADAILETALQENVSLVALSTHGRTGLARWVFGSVAEKVLRSSTGPVLVLRSFPGGRPAPPAELPLKHWLIPADGGEGTLAAIAALRELAKSVDATATVLHVRPPDDPLAASRWNAPEAPLAAAMKALADAAIPARLEHREGDPADRILAAAAELKADAIAMATHGRRGVSRWAYGSVTEKVLRGADLPLLVVRTSKG